MFWSFFLLCILIFNHIFLGKNRGRRPLGGCYFFSVEVGVSFGGGIIWGGVYNLRPKLQPLQVITFSPQEVITPRYTPLTLALDTSFP